MSDQALIEQENYTWQEFLAAVGGFLTVDRNRSGSNFDSYKLQIIRQALHILQNLVEQYQLNHEIIYEPQDTVLEGMASRFVKPPQSVLRNIFLASTCQADNGTSQCRRFECEPFPWKDRFALVQGRIPLNSGRGKFAVDPQGYTAYVYPAVYDCWLMSVHYDGLKLDYKDNEETPYDEVTAGAVAWFLKAHIAMETEHNIEIFDRYMKEFDSAKRLCFERERDKTQTKG